MHPIKTVGKSDQRRNSCRLRFDVVFERPLLQVRLMVAGEILVARHCRLQMSKTPGSNSAWDCAKTARTDFADGLPSVQSHISDRNRLRNASH